MTAKERPSRYPPMKLDIHTMRKRLALLRRGKLITHLRDKKPRRPR